MESAVGAYLLNSIRGTEIELFYWREGDYEVDFVLKHGERLVAIEVKSSTRPGKLSGMDLFKKQFNPDRILLVGEGGIPLQKFLKSSISILFQ